MLMHSEYTEVHQLCPRIFHNVEHKTLHQISIVPFSELQYTTSPRADTLTYLWPEQNEVHFVIIEAILFSRRKKHFMPATCLLTRQIQLAIFLVMRMCRAYSYQGKAW